MKKMLLLCSLCMAVSSAAFSQRIYLADTAFTTDVGHDGAPASCMASHVEYTGWNNDRGYDFWVADAFTVPADSTWAFDTVILYEVKYNTNPAYTFLNCNLQIYDAAPGLGGHVIWGDTSTNLLCSTGFSGIYKVDTFSDRDGILDSLQPIMYMKLYLSPAVRLTAGAYWLSWSAAGPGTNIAYSPDKVLPGRVNPPGQMARGEYNGDWKYLDDSGLNAGLDMIIKASPAALASLSVPTATNPGANGLGQNRPNPFSDATIISFFLQQAGDVTLNVYNAIGQLVATPLKGNTSAGPHLLTFKAGELPTGVYYYQLTTPAGAESRQMLLAGNRCLQRFPAVGCVTNERAGEFFFNLQSGSTWLGICSPHNSYTRADFSRPINKSINQHLSPRGAGGASHYKNKVNHTIF